MTLDYLDFEFSEDAQGHGSFDALAAVTPAQWPALLAQAQQVLAWAHAQFGPPQGEDSDGATWDFELQGLREVPTPLALAFDPGTGRLQAADGAPGVARLTLALTLSGDAQFCAALRDAFALD